MATAGFHSGYVCQLPAKEAAMKLLIAEDDPEMQKILKLYLQREGYLVNVVSDGRAAVDFLTEHPVDLVMF